ncbi:MAG: aminoglycoside phosphotransferase family protein [Minisyncoccia bacterium]|jgi:thiamine kinase-like enzyme
MTKSSKKWWKQPVENIFGSKSKIKGMHLLKHYGNSKIGIFRMKGDARTYLIKDYNERKFGYQEIKNLKNIRDIGTFHKPIFVANYKNFFVEEFIKGKIMQDILEKETNRENVRNLYLKAVDELVKIHTSAGFLKNKNDLKNTFKREELKRRINLFLFYIENFGFPSYEKYGGKIKREWRRAVEKVPTNIKRMVKHLGINEKNYLLGHGDYKPNNLILTKNGEIYVIDWLGMAKAQPWYDLAYLLTRLTGHEKEFFLKEYLEKMHKNGYLKETSLKEAENLLRTGIIYQQLQRAKSNAHRIKSKRDVHHMREFSAALDGLVHVIS